MAEFEISTESAANRMAILEDFLASLSEAQQETLMGLLNGWNKTNALDAVTEASGVPTGGIFESGSDANGDWIKFMDGTLIIHGTVDLTYVNTTKMTGTWTYPGSDDFDVAGDIFLSGTINVSTFNSGVATVTIGSCSPVTWGTIAVGSAIAQIYQDGASTFDAADDFEIRTFGIGRWFA